ncbi:MAG: heavy-metal-associated domain-containing protein [Burkholderiales bacterium]
METVVLNVKGMSCMGCVRSVQNVVGAVPGVSAVEVSLEKSQVSVAYDSASAPLQRIKNAIADAGYDVVG